MLVFKELILLIIMIPKCKSGDASNLDMPKRSPKLLPLREKVKVLYLIRKEKKNVCRSMVETNFLSMKL